MGKFHDDVRKILYQNQEEVDRRILNGIERYRKGTCKLSFVNEAGMPIKHVKLWGGLKTHLFNFGANLFMLDELETDTKNALYKQHFQQLFNMATLPFYWRDLEPEEGKPRYSKDSPRIYRRPAPDLCLQWCKETGIRPKMHCLNYDVWSPDWLERHNRTIIKEKIEKHFQELAQRYANDIYPWEVTNETLLLDHCTDFYFDDDYVEWSFQTAEKYFADNELIINEAMWHAWELYAANRTPYYMLIDRLLRSGHRIDAIGMQYHMFWPRESAMEHLRIAYDLKQFYDIMDLYGRFQRPLQITEITIPAYSTDPEDEALQAEILTRLYKLWFSHPLMEAIIYWNLVDGYAAFAEPGSEDGENYYHGGLLRYDLTPKPAYWALEQLICQEWHTSLDTEFESEYTFRGFYGEYDIMVEAKGVIRNISFELKPDQENVITITL